MRPGLTYEQVAAYLDAQFAETGTVPSIRRIVDALGGSATTVSRHRRRYLETREAGQADALPSDIEKGIAAAALSLAGRLWEQAQAGIAERERAANEHEARIEDEAEKRIAAAERQASEARAALVEVKAALEAERQAAAEIRGVLGHSAPVPNRNPDPIRAALQSQRQVTEILRRYHVGTKGFARTLRSTREALATVRRQQEGVNRLQTSIQTLPQMLEAARQNPLYG